MERMGLVWQVEQELERVISQGQLPQGGHLPAEHTLAQRYGVSRATVREALLKLAARGLVVQHPGRRSRAVALEQALTLENLSVALHARKQAPTQSRQLLEGFWALKRETAVELLSACCECASEADLKRLQEACLSLEDAVRWEPQARWAQLEFELLRLAARVAERPGHLLLLQSLERSFWGMVDRVVLQSDSQSVLQWAKCAYEGLTQRDAQALRRQLPALLQASDEHLLRNVWAAHEAPQSLPIETLPNPARSVELEPVGSEPPPAQLSAGTAARASKPAKEDKCTERFAVPTAPEHREIPAPGDAAPPPSPTSEVRQCAHVSASASQWGPAGGGLSKAVWLSDRFLPVAVDGRPWSGAPSVCFGAPPGALGLDVALRCFRPPCRTPNERFCHASLAPDPSDESSHGQGAADVP
ncbi:FadR/GntR family transcriptional regulator [Hyalangium rubrum]|uniref:GntR family transcriptional regulator n=1 Tax=Hyalangium rubrum TaxID=3103134 RepID=A0ABU5HHD5_9BACT|nr:GntR family transcriptional regulator [Hyalangium sp. s54d21]MDY7232766.1 GntR family transcriptional regulator [Hyalangium sp. s54d21]